MPPPSDKAFTVNLPEATYKYTSVNPEYENDELAINSEQITIKNLHGLMTLKSTSISLGATDNSQTITATSDSLEMHTIKPTYIADHTGHIGTGNQCLRMSDSGLEWSAPSVSLESVLQQSNDASGNSISNLTSIGIKDASGNSVTISPVHSNNITTLSLDITEDANDNHSLTSKYLPLYINGTMYYLPLYN